METAVGTLIIEHFSSLPNLRALCKVLHKLLDIVVMTMCAVLAGSVTTGWKLPTVAGPKRIGSRSSWSYRQGLLP